MPTARPRPSRCAEDSGPPGRQSTNEQVLAVALRGSFAPRGEFGCAGGIYSELLSEVVGARDVAKTSRNPG